MAVRECASQSNFQNCLKSILQVVVQMTSHYAHGEDCAFSPEINLPVRLLQNHVVRTLQRSLTRGSDIFPDLARELQEVLPEVIALNVHRLDVLQPFKLCPFVPC